MFKLLFFSLFLSFASASPQSWNDPKFDNLLNSCFETGFDVSYMSPDGGKNKASGIIVFDHGKFRAASSDCQFVFDGKSLCIIYEESKEVVISRYDGLKSVLTALIGPQSSVKPSFSGDKLVSLRIETENGTVVSITVPSFRYLSKIQDSSYFNKLKDNDRPDKFCTVDCNSLEDRGYVVTDLR